MPTRFARSVPSASPPAAEPASPVETWNPPARAFVPDEILLYDLTESPLCLKVRICLHLKGVPFRRVTLTLGRRRELRRLSPMGQVPVLVRGAEAIPDSRRIARHLEATHPSPALIPVGVEARAYAALLEEWADETLAFLVDAFKWLNPENRRAALGNTVGEMAGALLRPLAGRAILRRARRRYAAAGIGPEALPLLEERLRENLSTLATLLEGKPFLLGRVPTLADVAAFAQITCMQRYAERRLLEDVPTVTEWLERLADMPPVAAALAS